MDSKKAIPTSSNGIDRSLKAFSTFEQKYQQYKEIDLSESDTRSKVLDRVLIDVLGWNEADIRREGYNPSGYYDYLLTVPGFHFVIEAKKNFAEIVLPDRHRSITNGTLHKANKDIVNQIRKYLFEEGLQFGVLTNGHQWVIGKFINTDGAKWQSNKCIVFNGLQDLSNRIVEFYNLLARDSIINNSGFHFERDVALSGKTILGNASNPREELVRNQFSATLTPILDDVFGEIFNYDYLDNEELIRECFIENQETKKNRSEIERLFEDLPPRLEEVIPARNTKSIVRQLDEEISSHEISVKEVAPPKPIIIVGSKGAGKTTFINYLFKYALSKHTLDARPYIYIDFRKYTESDLIDNPIKIYKDILNSIYDSYPEMKLHSGKVLKRIFRKEIKRNEEGIWQGFDRSSKEYLDKLTEFLEQNTADVEYHFIKLSEYLIRERTLRVCIIIDNADQLSIAFQKEAFLFAQSLNAKARCNVIISLREGYYYRWRHKPPFDAFDSHVYHITAPPYGEVLQKRIDYALKQLKIPGKIRARGDALAGGTVQIDKQSVADFLESARQTLFGDTNSEMLEFLSQTTYPNIREGLKIFKRFLISGHTQVDEYILRQHLGPKSIIPIPIWEFMKAVALDNKLYYNHEISIVHNLFIPIEGSINHFLKIKLLKYLLANTKTDHGIEKFIQVDELISVFTDAGYRYRIVKEELEELLKFGLSDSYNQATDTDHPITLDLERSVSISRKGYYYLAVLKNRFHYIELVAQDTPIFDGKHFENLCSNFKKPNPRGKRSLSSRIQFVEAFISYLEEAELKESIESDGIAGGVVREIKNKGLNTDLKSIKLKSR